MSDEDIPFARDENTTEAEVALALVAQAGIETIQAARDLIKEVFRPEIDDPPEISAVDKAKVLGEVGPFITGLVRVAAEMEERKARQAGSPQTASKPSGGSSSRGPAKKPQGGSRPVSESQNKGSGDEFPDGDARTRNKEVMNAVGKMGFARGQDTYDEIDRLKDLAGIRSFGPGWAWGKFIATCEAEGVQVDSSVS